MTQKIFSISALFVSLTLLAILGCGSDEKVTEKPKKPTEPESFKLNEDLLGTWKVVSINDGPALEFLVEDEPDVEDRPKISINKFNYDFAEDGSMTLNVDAVMSQFPEEPPNEAGEREGKVEITGMWSGTYGPRDSHLTIIITEKDLSFTPLPKDLFEKIFGIKEIEAQQELTEGFNSHIFTPFAKTFFTIEGETLNLESSGSAKNKMVLEKQ